MYFNAAGALGFPKESKPYNNNQGQEDLLEILDLSTVKAMWASNNCTEDKKNQKSKTTHPRSSKIWLTFVYTQFTF